MQAGHQADHDDSGESGHHSPLLVMGGAATAGTAANSKAAVSPVFLIPDPSRVLLYGYTPSPHRCDQVPLLFAPQRENEIPGLPPPSLGKSPTPPSIGQVHNQIADPVPTLNPGRQDVAPLQQPRRPAEHARFP